MSQADDHHSISSQYRALLQEKEDEVGHEFESMALIAALDEAA